MKNKYLILADGRSPHTLKWIKELVPFFDLYLISLNGISPEVFNYLNAENIHILNKKINSAGGNFKQVLKLHKIKRIIKLIQPNFINAHYLSSYGILAAMTRSVSPNAKLIQSTWGSDILVTPFSNFFRKKIAQFALNKADYITSDSWYVADVTKQLVDAHEIIVFPFGFEHIEHPKTQKDKIIFSNRALKSFYNIDQVLKWFAEQRSDFKLVIANDGVEKESLKALAKKLNIFERVDFVGFLSEKEQKNYYQSAMYYISIPSSDATSVSLLESMMYGAIPIVSNIPANREWILDGVNGVFFDFNKKLSNIKTEHNFAEINHNILKNRALFKQSIQNFISKVK